jgi:hypothetical protein
MPCSGQRPLTKRAALHGEAEKIDRRTRLRVVPDECDRCCARRERALSLSIGHFGRYGLGRRQPQGGDNS